MKLLIFGGTTEGRILAQKLSTQGADVTVSVATPLGAEELAGIPSLTVWTGRKNAAEMAALLPGFDLCVDATHPYAAEATANIQKACAAVGLPLRRLLRPESQAVDVVRAASCAEAAALLAGRPGNILLATGAKELGCFAALEKERLFARVLPTHESLAACEALGLAHKHILALQGPFTQKLNEAMLEQYNISWLVTKDGGQAGGFAEKLAAAQTAGARLVLVGRPEGRGERMEMILQSIEEALV